MVLREGSPQSNNLQLYGSVLDPQPSGGECGTGVAASMPAGEAEVGRRDLDLVLD